MLHDERHQFLAQAFKETWPWWIPVLILLGAISWGMSAIAGQSNQQQHLPSSAAVSLQVAWPWRIRSAVGHFALAWSAPQAAGGACHDRHQEARPRGRHPLLWRWWLLGLIFVGGILALIAAVSGPGHPARPTSTAEANAILA